MKILWITNDLMPNAAEAIGQEKSPFESWLSNSAKELIKNNNIELYCATVSSKIKKMIKVNKESISYFILPLSKSKIKYNPELENCWRIINAEVTPDVIHIHGTEYAHGLAWIKACGNTNVVASIQGLTSVYLRYSTGSISFCDILKNITLGDIKSKNTEFQQNKNLKQRGEIEEEYIKSLKYIIGRTDWDKCHALAINPKIQYLFCNETLRPIFYNHIWKYDNCEKHTIFLSQARNPIKGCHMMLKALPLVLNKYPDTKVYIANSKEIEANSLIAKLKQSGYYRYLRNLVERLNLKANVVFLPTLNEQEMQNYFINSHIFVNPSSIENSPNSLGEAQLVGIPCISSYVGGTPEFMGYGKAGTLYRFEEYEMLAVAICRVFSMNYIQSEIDEGKMLAQKRHDPSTNAQQLLNIYTQINNANK